MFPPQWYQELSIPQINKIRSLGTAIKCDFDENKINRTRKILTDIGIISTFIKFSSNNLKKLLKKSKTDPGKFLCEIYCSITGNYFEEERNKKYYNCNERVILTAIAFLYLPETIIELHRRLPIPIVQKNDPLHKRKSFPRVRILQQQSIKSPYLKSHFEEYNNLILLHNNQELKSQKISKLVVKPRIILPPPHLIIKSNKWEPRLKSEKNSQISYQKSQSYSNKYVPKKNSVQHDKNFKLNIKTNDNLTDNQDKESDNNNEINYPIGHEYMWKKYLPMSLKNIQEDLVLMSNKADDILNDVYKTTRMIFNIDFCSEHCLNEIKKESQKSENLLIDSLTLDEKFKIKFIDSLTLNSPPQSLPVSSTNSCLQHQKITLSEDKLIKKNIISGLITADGKTIYQIGGIFKDHLHISYNIPCLSNNKIKNTLPCNCYCLKDYYNKDSVNNKINNFILASEARENIQKEMVKLIDHTTCTKRFYIDNNNVEEKKLKTCTKCINFTDKCDKNLFKEIIKFYNEQTTKIKFYISGIKKISDYKDSCQPIISNVTLFTPITPDLTKSDNDTLNPSFKQNLVNNHGKKKFIDKHNKIDNIKIEEEILNLYKQVEELDDIKEKFDENLKTVKKNYRSITISKHVIKKLSKKDMTTVKKNIKTDSDDDNKIGINKQVKDNKNIVDEIKNYNEKDTLKSKIDLITLMKIALREMANENFLLAKLPDCDKIPQLRVWIKYRKGFVASLLEKDELCDKIQNINEQSDDSLKIAAPQIQLDKYQGTFKYSVVNKLENFVELEKKLFYSKVRKSRVNKSRLAWNQLQFDNNFSDLSFKSTFFIYHPAKEADGFMLKPYGFQSSIKKK